MDGRPGIVMRSLRGRLFISLTITIIVAGLAAGALAYDWAFDEAIELQDSILIQIGAVAAAIHVPDAAPASGGVDAEAQVVIEPLDGSGSDSEDGRSLKNLPDGLHTAARNGAPWRMLIRTRADAGRIAVGQPTAIRDEIARDSALRTVLPLLALIPCLMLIVALVIRQSLRPVLSLAERLDARQADQLQRLPLEGTPNELHPFIASINRLLERIQALIDQQRRFIADAAHELRTPITAISLQAENLDHAELQPESRERLAALRSGTRRTAHLLEQLLSLARYDMGDMPDAPATSLDQCTKEVVADLLPRAADRGIDLGFAIVEPVFVRGEPAMLAVMVRNLIDNAIRHIPKGGRIDIGVYREKTRAILQVEDNGPGIPEADLARMFEPFVRGRGVVEDGSGLGLSIVKRIVERLNGSLSLENIAGTAASGLRLIVSLPSFDQPTQEPASASR
jgi:two-component system, OmpR family, sensor kinase